MLKKTAYSFSLLAVLFLLGAPAALADSHVVTGKDIEVAVRAFGFVYGIPRDTLGIEIVYDPSSAVSRSEAEGVSKLISSGGAFAGRNVSGRLVPYGQMGSTGGKVAYITHGLSAQYDALTDAARRSGMITFSTDFACVEKTGCVMAVEASPRIRIEISRTAAASAGVEFSQALKLMVREVE